jgi:signal transduction histidine kinase
VDRLRGLLENLLTTSKLEPINQKLELQYVDFKNLLRNTVNSYLQEAEKKSIDLSYQLNKKEKVMIEIDAAKLTWAVSNLLTNALSQTPKNGKVTVKVESKQEFILVQICDTGPGIESFRQKSIFEKFSSYYDLRVARSGGAGLGLAIAKEIVIAHGGRIWVCSRPGFGSEFSFTIPFKNTKSVSVGTSTKQVINENGNLKLQKG